MFELCLFLGSTGRLAGSFPMVARLLELQLPELDPEWELFKLAGQDPELPSRVLKLRLSSQPSNSLLAVPQPAGSVPTLVDCYESQSSQLISAAGCCQSYQQAPLPGRGDLLPSWPLTWAWWFHLIERLFEHWLSCRICRSRQRTLFVASWIRFGEEWFLFIWRWHSSVVAKEYWSQPEDHYCLSIEQAWLAFRS